MAATTVVAQRTALGLGALAIVDDTSGVPIASCADDANWTGGVCPSFEDEADNQLAFRVQTLEDATVSAGAVTQDVFALAHGFSVGTIVQLTGVGWVGAQADSLTNAQWQGMVSAIPDVDNFTVTLAGAVSPLFGLTTGTEYYLDSGIAGGFTATEPSPPDVSAPIGYAVSGNTMWIQPLRPLDFNGADGLAYTPTTSSDWNPVPTDVQGALDELGSRTFPSATPNPSPSVAPTVEWHPNDDTLRAIGSAAFALSSGTVSTIRSAGKSVVVFNGSTFYTFGTNLGYPASYTFVFAVHFTTIGAQEYIMGAAPATGANEDTWGGMELLATGQLRYYFGDGAAGSYGITTLAPIAAAKTWYVIAMRYTTGSTECEIWVDGTSYAITTEVTAASAAGGDGVSPFRIGRLGLYSSGLALNATLGDFYYWDSPLSDANRIIVQDALQVAY